MRRWQRLRPYNRLILRGAKMKDDISGNDDDLGVSEPLGSIAYVVTDDANCLYRPERHAAVRVTPPYGSKLDVIREADGWVLVGFYGMQAWSPRDNLSAHLIGRVAGIDVGILPSASGDCHSRSGYTAPLEQHVEYGPRGGRFVRTASGFRRYL
jgi:hypothetical protein